jgi:phage/plasmid primase-like uncharacterized protein
MSEHLREWVERARLTNIEDVAESLGLRLQKSYGELVGPCPRCGGDDRFVVSPRKQLFRCRKCLAAGDVIALAAHAEGLDCNRRNDFLRAVELVNGEPPPDATSTPDPKRTAELTQRREQAQRDRDAEQKAQQHRNREWAMRIWNESRPATNTPVQTYLRSRGITIAPPLTLRFHPALLHRPSGLAWPAMIAVVTLDRAILGVHRTWLKQDGSGKAPVEHQKMSLGPVHGGAVRLAPVADRLMVAEGIETALSVMQAVGGSTWAALSEAGMRALVLPPEVQDVIVCADGDAVGEHAATMAAVRWRSEGREVRIAKAPPGKDFNDLLVETDA